MTALTPTLIQRLKESWRSADARWLSRRVLCRGCGYDLRGIETGVCPECGKGFGGEPTIGDDGRYTLRAVVIGAAVLGPVVASPWVAFLMWIVWRISKGSRPTNTQFMTGGLVLLAFTVCAILALGWAATARTTRLFYACLRALAASGVMLATAYLTWMLAWRLGLATPHLWP